MIGKKINQLATELAPVSTDLTIIGNPTTGVSKKITLAQLGAIFSGAVSFYSNLASFPATGTLDVIFCAKDTKKLYLWSGSAYVEVFPSQALLDTYQLRSEKGNANGYASLDSSGKVPISQLPSSIMEYKGTWNASTNTPTLANGTGDTGDVYICNVAGTVNFGAGPLTFAVGDYVIYSGTIWQRSSGAVGTVTSVAVSRSGDALAITGSPVTTSGTINIAFAGVNTQYVRGDGTLATFPSIISEAQNLITEVYNKSGATITKGTVVYINGGQGNLPSIAKALATGDATSAQTYGIVQNDITNNNNGYVVAAGRLGNLDTQAFTEGTQLYLSATTAGTYTSTKQYAPNHLVYVGIIVRSHPTQGIIEVKIQNGYELDEIHNVAAQTPTNNDGLFWEASTSLWKNKSLSTILGGSPAYGSGTQNRLTKFTANAGELINSNIHDTGTVIYNNNPSDGQFAWQFNGSQTTGLSYGALIVAGTNASDIALRIQNASSTSEYFFVWGDGRVQINNIPNATTDTDRFLVSDSGVIKYRTGSQLLSDIGGQPAGTYVTSVGLSVPTGFAVSGSPVTSSGTLALSFASGYSLPTNASQTNWDTAYTNRITSATSPLSITSNVISIAQASGSTNGYLSSTDWTTFNNKQNALTNPVTGTGTTNYLPKFTGASTIGNSAITDDGSTVALLSRALSVSGASTLTGRVQGTEIGVTRDGSNTIGDGPWFRWTNAAQDRQMLTQLNASNGLTTWAFNGSAWSSLLTLTQSGNLGLGVTPSAWFSGSVAFQLGATGVLSARNGTTETVALSSNAILNGSGSWQYIINASASLYETYSGQHIWRIAPSGTAGNAISFTQAMTLNASGNLSIGNTNNTYKLDVSGEGRFSGRLLVSHATSGNYGAVIYNTSATGEGLVVRGGSTSSHSAFVVQPYDGSVALFNVLATGAATFSSSVTATTGLTVGSLGSGSDAIITLATNASGAPRTIYYKASTATINFTGTGGTDLMTLTNGGNLGIGTTSPSWKLDVRGTGMFNGDLQLDLGDLNATKTLFFNANSTTGGSYGNIKWYNVQWDGNTRGEIVVEGDGALANGRMVFKTGSSGSNATEKMRITSGGNVGIGTTSPSGRLHAVAVDATSSNNVIYLENSASTVLLRIRNDGAFFTGTASSSPYNNTTASLANLIVTSGGSLERSTASSQRFKDNIQDWNGNGLNTILALKPRTFKYKKDYYDKADIQFLGLIAEEVAEVSTYLADYENEDRTGQVENVRYANIVVPLIKAIQELKAELDTLKNK